MLLLPYIIKEENNHDDSKTLPIVAYAYEDEEKQNEPTDGLMSRITRGSYLPSNTDTFKQVIIIMF